MPFEDRAEVSSSGLPQETIRAKRMDGRLDVSHAILDLAIASATSALAASFEVAAAASPDT